MFCHTPPYYQLKGLPPKTMTETSPAAYDTALTNKLKEAKKLSED